MQLKALMVLSALTLARCNYTDTLMVRIVEREQRLDSVTSIITGARGRLN